MDGNSKYLFILSIFYGVYLCYVSSDVIMLYTTAVLILSASAMLYRRLATYFAVNDLNSNADNHAPHAYPYSPPHVYAKSIAEF